MISGVTFLVWIWELWLSMLDYSILYWNSLNHMNGKLGIKLELRVGFKIDKYELVV